MEDPFFLNPGDWTGEGLLQFKNSSLAYPYTAVWHLSPAKGNTVYCTQHLTLSEVEVVYEIAIIFSKIENQSFNVSFENSEYGMLTGTGVWSEKIVQLQLYDVDKVKIFGAVYEKEPDGAYQVQNTLLLKNGDILLIDGVLASPKKAKTA